VCVRVCVCVCVCACAYIHTFFERERRSIVEYNVQYRVVQQRLDLTDRVRELD